MVDGDFLRQCERHPLIINSSRGAVVRSQDAWELLKENQLRGLLLDVVDLEKASLLGLRNQPDWFKAMCNDPRTLITPHVAGWSEQSFPRMASILLGKIITSPVTE
jgi:D-3-phosphoglycerate dehydrogenase